MLEKLHEGKAEALPESAVVDPVALVDALAEDERAFATGREHIRRRLQGMDHGETMLNPFGRNVWG